MTDGKFGVHGKGSIAQICVFGFQSLVAHPCLVFVWPYFWNNFKITCSKVTLSGGPFKTSQDRNVCKFHLIGTCFTNSTDNFFKGKDLRVSPDAPNSVCPETGKRKRVTRKADGKLKLLLSLGRGSWHGKLTFLVTHFSLPISGPLVNVQHLKARVSHPGIVGHLVNINTPFEHHMRQSQDL